MDIVNIESNIVLGLLVIAGLFIGYELIRNRETVGKIIQTGESIFVIEEKVVEEAVDIVEPPVVVIADIVSGKPIAETKLDYVRIEGGSNAADWLQVVFGNPWYNNGWGSFRYRATVENSEKLAKVYGGVRQYLEGLDVGSRDLFTRVGLDGVRRLSPFQARQNLDVLPVASNLHGFVGKNVKSLKESIWTEWDELPALIGNWEALSERNRNKVKRLVRDDRALLEEMKRGELEGKWIIEDRVLTENELLEKKGIKI